MKTIYFVRHGESTANTGFPTYQGEASELTEKGVEQAKFIAKRCSKLSIEALIASTAKRARQTAENIAEEIGTRVEVNELFTERKIPKELLGKSTADPATKAMHDEWMLSFFRDGARVGSGENFSDLKARVLQALEYLRERPEKHILVATHGFFLHMTIAVVVLGESLSAAEFNRIGPAVWMDNTGITRIEYRDQVFSRVDGKRHTGWVLRVWNDHAHLG
ncbi:histidine phosphatase family protein [Candidatus Kaiserbacteria bacterium]|nr:histidine phosphatase family protein [Candidatus Kaiserbacteria bacterium]